MMAAIIGFLLGLAVGGEGARSRWQGKLSAFAEARGIRLLDRDGNEVPLSELIEAAKKR